MYNPELTVVYFDSGGYSTEDNKLVWKENNMVRTLAMKTPMSDVSYIQLLTGIAKKIGIDESTTKVKMSYMPFIVDYDTPIYILEDDDVSAFLLNTKDGCRSVLHVEVVQNDLDEENIDDLDESTIRDSNSVREDDEMANNGTVCLNHGQPSGLGLDENPNETLGNEQRINLGGLIPTEEDYDLDFVVLEDEATENGHRVGVEWDDGMTDLELHKEFEEKPKVFDIIQQASHKNCFEFKVIKSDSTRLVVKCREKGCKWGVRATKLKDTSCFSVRTYYNKHSCSRASTSTSRHRRKGTARLIARMLEKDYAGRFDTPKPKILVDMLQTEIGCKVSYWTAWRGRKKAADSIRGTPEESYANIYSYMYTLEKMNPGTKWDVELDMEHRFLYLFFALGVSIEGFKHMRKVLIVDATHLKTAEGGVLAVVTAQDGNHQNYPIAFGILDGEKECSWTWFLSELERVIPDRRELVFISDRNQGLRNAVREVYPLSKHGFCNFHLAQNAKVKESCKSKGHLVNKFLACSEAYTEGQFLKLYAAFERKFPLAARYITGLDEKEACPKETWARCYFPGDRYNIMSSNSVESINGVLVAARRLSVLPMIDAIVKKLTEWFCKRRASSADLVGGIDLVPFVDLELHDLCKDAHELTVSDINSHYQQFTVIGRDGHNYSVDLKMKTCTCKQFDIDKYPCVHGIAAAIEAKVELHTLCSKYFLSQRWALAYSQTIYPVPHASEWVIPNCIREMYALPPAYEKKKKEGEAGRTQETRTSSVGEHSRRRKRKRRRGLGRWFEPSEDVPDV